MSSQDYTESCTETVSDYLRTLNSLHHKSVPCTLQISYITVCTYRIKQWHQLTRRMFQTTNKTIISKES